MKADGSIERIQHAETIGFVTQVNKQQALEILLARVSAVSQQQLRPRVTMTLSEFVRTDRASEDVLVRV